MDRGSPAHLWLSEQRSDIGFWADHGSPILRRDTKIPHTYIPVLPNFISSISPLSLSLEPLDPKSVASSRDSRRGGRLRTVALVADGAAAEEVRARLALARGGRSFLAVARGGDLAAENVRVPVMVASGNYCARLYGGGPDARAGVPGVEGLHPGHRAHAEAGPVPRVARVGLAPRRRAAGRRATRRAPRRRAHSAI